MLKHPLLSLWRVEILECMYMYVKHDVNHAHFMSQNGRSVAIYYTSVTEPINSHDCSKLKQYNII